MEKTIDKRIERLREVLKTLKMSTQPIDGHTDPGSITDCWAEVSDYLEAIESMAKKNVYETWLTAFARTRNENLLNYDQWAEQLGTKDLLYIKTDNSRITNFVSKP